MRGIHFISGLPRSGSTLLSAILKQNPRFRAGMSSPVGSMVLSLRTMMSQNREISTLIDDEQRLQILRGVFQNYYHDCAGDEVVFDTGRGWAGRIQECRALFPDAKFILTLRDPAWIFDSVERIIRRNPLRQSAMVSATANIEERMAMMIDNKGFIGGPLGNVKEAVFGTHAKHVLMVEYDALCADPESAIAGIYQFLGEEPFEHDFSYVSYEQESFDSALQTPGLHTVEGPVRVIPRDTVVPPELFESLSARAFWYRAKIDRASQITLR